jgi:hypothetical protein
VITKVDLFVERLQPFTKSLNRVQSISWWRSTVGQAEEASQRHHPFALPPTARVIAVDRIERKGGYSTIRRVRIEGVSKIQSWWEFAAKWSNQSRTRPHLAKMEHLDGSMAVRIPHAGVIHFFCDPR